MFNAEKFIQDQVVKIRAEVDGKAIIAASGGVDSTVCAALVGKSIGDRLLAVYVDTGFMRKGETESVDQMLRRLGVNHIVVDASDEYFKALKGVTDPEKKRKIIGEKFIRVFEREAKKFGAEYLVQGTIAPDWIESGGGLRDTSNSHHNVGGLPENMDVKLVEPLRDLYKDEVSVGDDDAYFWGTHACAELDMLVLSEGKRFGFEFKYADAPGRSRSMLVALDELYLEHLWIVYPGEQAYSVHSKILSGRSEKSSACAPRSQRQDPNAEKLDSIRGPPRSFPEKVVLGSTQCRSPA